MTTSELIADMTERIARDFNPLRIILFGSYARAATRRPTAISTCW